MVFQKGKRLYPLSNIIAYFTLPFTDEQALIKKRIRYNAENRTWTLGNEAWGTFPKIFWYYPTTDRCVARSTEVNKQKWYYTQQGKPVYHDIELQCTKKNNLISQCGDSEFLCADMKQCVPALWKCDGITDCSDGSDECPRLNETEIKTLNTLFKIDNDIHILKRSRHTSNNIS